MIWAAETNQGNLNFRESKMNKAPRVLVATAFPVLLLVMFLLGLLLVACSGCDLNEPHACSANSVAGISVKIYDAETSLPAACGATMWIEAGGYSEKVESDFYHCDGPDSTLHPTFRGAYEREGTYTVLVLKDGYVPWIETGVNVNGGRCHVSTVFLEANLVPEEE
jgi:hypothetical protein